jgi:hypothetical protein
VSLYGYHDEKPDCKTNQDLIDFATSLPSQELVNVILKAKPVYSVPKIFAVPCQTWRRYDKLSPSQFPRHFLAVGDSVVSLNPTFGQGMATAARHAMVINGTSIRSLFNGNTFRIQKAIGGKVWLPFLMNAVDDNKYRQTTGFRPPCVGFAQKFMDKAQLEVNPTRIARPDILFSVLRS